MTENTCKRSKDFPPNASFTCEQTHISSECPYIETCEYAERTSNDDGVDRWYAIGYAHACGYHD